MACQDLLRRHGYYDAAFGGEAATTTKKHVFLHIRQEVSPPKALLLQVSPKCRQSVSECVCVAKLGQINVFTCCFELLLQKFTRTRSNRASCSEIIPSFAPQTPRYETFQKVSLICINRSQLDHHKSWKNKKQKQRICTPIPNCFTLLSVTMAKIIELAQRLKAISLQPGTYYQLFPASVDSIS